MGGWYISATLAEFGNPAEGNFGVEADQGDLAAFRNSDHGICFNTGDNSTDASQSGPFVLPYKLNPNPGTSFPLIDRSNKVYLPSGTYINNAAGDHHHCVINENQIVLQVQNHITNPSATILGSAVVTRSGDLVSVTGLQAPTDDAGDFLSSRPFQARVDDTHFMRCAQILGSGTTGQLQLCEVDAAGNVSVVWSDPFTSFCVLWGMSFDNKMLGYTGSRWKAITFDESGIISEYDQVSGVASPDWTGYGSNTNGAFKETGDEGIFKASTGWQAVVWTGSAFQFSSVYTYNQSGTPLPGGVGISQETQGQGPISGNWGPLKEYLVDGISQTHYTAIHTISQSGTSLTGLGETLLFPGSRPDSPPAYHTENGRRAAGIFTDRGLDPSTSPTFGNVIAQWDLP